MSKLVRVATDGSVVKAMVSDQYSSKPLKQLLRLHRWFTALLVWQIFAVGQTVVAQDLSQQARRVIRGSWYDRAEQTYVTPSMPDDYDNSLRQNGRIAFDPAQSSSPNTSSKAATDFWAIVGNLLWYFFVIILIALAVIGLVLLITHTFLSYRPREDSPTIPAQTFDPARIEELPLEAVSVSGDPLTLARRLAAQGRFDEAIVQYYGYQLLALDQARKIHLQRGKTNGMYLAELKVIPLLHDMLTTTVERFENVYFGKHSLTQQSFLEAWNYLSEFQSLVSANVKVQADA